MRKNPGTPAGMGLPIHHGLGGKNYILINLKHNELYGFFTLSFIPGWWQGRH